MLDILCVGDSKLDIFFQIPDTSPHFGLDKENNKWLISFGEKISIDKYVLDIGGNATNTAVGISRLGFNVGLCAEIGKDEFSQKILNRLKEENINTNSLLQTDNEKTSFSVAISYKGDRTLFTEHAKRQHNFNFGNLETKFVYLTSLGEEWEKAYEKTLEFVLKNNLKLAFNPGSLQLAKRGKTIADIFERTDFLFVNKEEAEEILYGRELNLSPNNPSAIKKLLYGLRSLGVKNAIITDSDNGSFAQDEKDNIYSLGVIKVDVVEKTGAGDAYCAGFLGALLSQKPIDEAMIWGEVNSASVIGKIGAEEGLLTKKKLEDNIKKLNNINPSKL
jgi:ribokinase